MKNAKIASIYVNDTKRTRAFNEGKVYRDSFKNREPHKGDYKRLLCMDVHGSGMENLFTYITPELFEELIDELPASDFYVTRYGLEEDSLLELLDNMPCYAALTIEIELEEEDGFSPRYHFILVKESNEAHSQPAIFRVDEFSVGGKEK